MAPPVPEILAEQDGKMGAEKARGTAPERHDPGKHDLRGATGPRLDNRRHKRWVVYVHLDNRRLQRCVVLEGCVSSPRIRVKLVSQTGTSGSYLGIRSGQRQRSACLKKSHPSPASSIMAVSLASK